MAVTSKSGNQTESFSVFKQKFGKQSAAFKGFKQHFSAITINQEKSSKSHRTNSVMVLEDEENVDEKRGFVPSDVLNDPNKREFLTQLSKRMWMEKERLLSKCRVLCTVWYVWAVISPSPHKPHCRTILHWVQWHPLHTDIYLDLSHITPGRPSNPNMFLISVLGIWKYSGLKQF